MRDLSELLQATATTGEAFLKLCQTLRSEGVDLAKQPRLQQILSQLDNSININPANLPRSTPHQLQQIPTAGPKHAKHMKPSPLILADREYASLIKSGPLRLSDPRIDRITNSQYLPRLQKALRNRTARAEFPVGTIIPDVWKNPRSGEIYFMPLMIVDYRKFQTVQYGERFGAVLLRRIALPVLLTFDKEGQNDFGKSDLMDWLNPDSKDWLNVKGDYAKGCSNNLLRATVDVQIDNLSSVRFFPPSAEEIHLNPNRRLDLENLVWEYFRDTPTRHNAYCPKRAFLDPHGTAISWWLRSAGYKMSNLLESVYYITMSGSLSCDYTVSGNYVVPASIVA